MTPTATALEPIDQKALDSESQAKALVIASNEDRERAEEITQTLKALEDEIFKDRDEPRAKAYENYLYHLKRLNDSINPVKAARKLVKDKCIAWDNLQERIRQDAQRKADEEAKKREEEAQLAAALEAEQSGDTETAAQILEQPIQAAPVFVPRSSPAPSRLTAGRKVYYASVIDIKKLCEAIGNGTASAEFVMGLNKDPKTGIISSPALNKIAKIMTVPGVVMKPKTV